MPDIAGDTDSQTHTSRAFAACLLEDIWGISFDMVGMSSLLLEMELHLSLMIGNLNF